MSRVLSVRARTMVVAAAVGVTAALTSGVPPASAEPPSQPVLLVGDPGGAGDVDSPTGVVFGPRGEPSAALSAPTVLDDGPLTYLWFCGRSGPHPSAIGMKYSTDHGRSWSSGTGYSLYPSSDGADRQGTCDPSVVRAGDYYYLAYQA